MISDKRTAGRNPWLDILRVGILVPAVLIDHGFLACWPKVGEIISINFNGTVAVSVFFVLAGYLVPLSIQRDKAEGLTGKQGMKFFMLRRFCRTMVQYFLLMLFLQYWFWHGGIAGTIIPRQYWFFCGEYSGSLYPGSPTMPFMKDLDLLACIAPTWALQAEEKWWLIAPLIAYFFSQKTFKMFMWGVASGGLIYGAVSSYMAVNCHGIFFARMAQFGSGALLALYPDFVKGLKMRHIFWVIILGWEGNIVIWRFFNHGDILWGNDQSEIITSWAQDLVGGILGIGLVCLSINGWNITQKNQTVTKMLKNKIFKILGVMSYSVYLWQAVILNLVFYHAKPTVFVCAARLALITLVALAFYFCLDRWAIKAGADASNGAVARKRME